MANATANETLHGFVFWLKRNPFKSVEAGFTHDDLDNMLAAYITVNASDMNTGTVADPLAYGATQDIPGKANDGSELVDGAGISFTTPTQAVTDKSKYPDEHFGA